MASFEIHGLFKIDWENRKGGRHLVFKDFWSQDAEAFYLAQDKGCYVFAIRNKNLTPIYVGKATKSFKQQLLILLTGTSIATGLVNSRRELR